MTVTVSLDKALRSIGTNDRGFETRFDTSIESGGLASASSPVQILLEAAGACMIMDIVPLLRKRKKNVIGLTIELHGTRRDEHPRIFTHVHMILRLTSPDATSQELEHCIALSEEKYCTVSNTLKLAGARMTHEAHIIRDGALSDLERADQPL
jgi:putative redox protein